MLGPLGIRAILVLGFAAVVQPPPQFADASGPWWLSIMPGTDAQQLGAAPRDDPTAWSLPDLRLSPESRLSVESLLRISNRDSAPHYISVMANSALSPAAVHFSLTYMSPSGAPIGLVETAPDTVALAGNSYLDVGVIIEVSGARVGEQGSLTITIAPPPGGDVHVKKAA